MMVRGPISGLLEPKDMNLLKVANFSKDPAENADEAKSIEVSSNLATEIPSSNPSPPSTSQVSNCDSIPDGGFSAWSVVFGSWCCLFTSFGWIDCIGIFQNYYESKKLKGYSPSAVAWITSVEASMMYISAPVFGKVYDNYGPTPLLYIGAFAHVVGLMMTSLAREYYQFILAQSLCSALGAAAVFYAGNNPIGTWFLGKRALAFGVVSAGASASGILLPIMIPRLLRQVGFGWTMRICSFMFLFLLALAILTVKPRRRPEPQPWALRDFIKPLGEQLFLFNFLGSFFFFLGLFIPFNFLIAAAQHDGMKADMANYQLAILNGTSVLGRVIPGWFGDKFGRFNVMIITMLLSALLVFGLWIPARSTTPTIVFSALFGFTSGTFVSMGPALIQQISKVEEIGMRMGTSFCFISIAVLIGNPIAGALITRNDGEYLYLKILSGIAMGVGAVFMISARHVQCGWRMEAV